MDKFVNTLNEVRNAYTDHILKIPQASDAAEETNAIYSVIQWGKGIISELGNRPSRWKIFARYGGYGAVFATGLLGFYKFIGPPIGRPFKTKYRKLWCFI
jgi:hypothetical protein